MAQETREGTHPTGEDEALAGLPVDGLSPETVSIMAWQAKEMPELFRQAYPDPDSLRLRDRVLAELMKMILSGQLPARPGKLASESQVVKRIKGRLNETVSRTPVREALAILVRDGFVRQLPQRGFEVVEVSGDETREALSLCGEVEALALERLLTPDRPPGFITPGRPRDLIPLRKAQEDLAKAAENNDRYRWMLGDTAFHVGLALSAGLEDAARSIERWRQKVHLYSLTHLEGDEVMERATGEHAEIIEAITKQPDRAVELLDEHLEHTTEWLGLSGNTEVPAELVEPARAAGWPEDLVLELLSQGAEPSFLTRYIAAGVTEEQVRQLMSPNEFEYPRQLIGAPVSDLHTTLLLGRAQDAGWSQELVSELLLQGAEISDLDRYLAAAVTEEQLRQIMALPMTAESSAVEHGIGRGVALEPGKYNAPIEELNLSVRAYNWLKRGGLMTVGQVLEKSEKELLSLRNFGRRAYGELQKKLSELGYIQAQSADAGPDAPVEGDENLNPRGVPIELNEAGQIIGMSLGSAAEQATTSSFTPEEAQRS